jgi:hypothetical protein
MVVTLAGLTALLSLAIWQSAIRDQLVVRRDSRNEAVRWMRRNLPVTAMVLVPTELGMHPRTFGRIRWSSVSVTLQPDGNALQVAAEAAGATHVLWPDWGRDLRFAREHELARIRGMAPPGRHLAEFGTRPVLVDYGGGPVPSGDPRLSVVELAEMP